MNGAHAGKAPMTFWIVGIVSLLWNSFGAVDYVMTQTANEAYLANFTPEQRAFFTSFPMWMEAAWALGVWGALAGSILLLMRNRHAVTAFGVSLAGLAVSSVWQFGIADIDMAKVFGGMPMIMTGLIWVIAIALFVYARRQRAAGRLR